MRLADHFPLLNHSSVCLRFQDALIECLQYVPETVAQRHAPAVYTLSLSLSLPLGNVVDMADPAGPTDIVETVAQSLATCFRGLDIPQPKLQSEAMQYIVGGIVFLHQIAIVDPVFKMVFRDVKDTVETTRTPEQFVKNWHALNAVLFDHGLEISADVTFSILAGQWHIAAQLALELQRLNDKSFLGSRIVLHKVGPEIGVRLRLHPFLGQALSGPNATSPSAPQGRGRGQGIAASLIAREPTRLLIHDAQRFAKKRALVVEQLERLKLQEIKAQRLKERRDREAAKAAAEAAKSSEMAEQVAAQEQYLKESLLLYRNDPAKVAEKKRRTELLKELEALEAQAIQDQRRMAKMKRQSSPRGRVAISPQGPSSAPPGARLSPVRLKEAGAIPFSHYTPSSLPPRGSAPRKS